jgi:hypothetical protein
MLGRTRRGESTRQSEEGNGFASSGFGSTSTGIGPNAATFALDFLNIRISVA